VQNVFLLKESTAVALTIAFYYSPKGRSIQRPLKDVQLTQAAGQEQGGVEPDVTVRIPPPSRLRVALDASGSFTTFATEVVRSRVLGPAFQVDGALLDEFRAWLAKRNIQPGVPEWTAEVAWTRDRLKQEILNLTAGVEKGDEVEMARDPFVLQALGALRGRSL
jgi:carboxyl-terminal processing protease